MTNAGPSLQNYGTPWYLVRALERELREAFALDVCAERWSAKARAFYTAKDNGLTSPWRSPAWCNPPYEDQQSWLEKAVAELARGVTSVLLLKAATSANYWKDNADHGQTRLVKGRIHFIHPLTRRPHKQTDFASAFVLFGPRFPPGSFAWTDARTGELLTKRHREAA